jgi:hypothetical protein
MAGRLRMLLCPAVIINFRRCDDVNITSQVPLHFVLTHRRFVSTFIFDRHVGKKNCYKIPRGSTIFAPCEGDMMSQKLYRRKYSQI